MHPLHHHHQQQQQQQQQSNHHVHDHHHSSSNQQPLPSSSTGDLLFRKKRRGMVEKKRRDRINASLNELKRLVPSAAEKQGSAKLEKAEILQLTVDHLKNLHAKGFDTFSFEPHSFASKYHRLGFHECINQVEQFLTYCDGMNHYESLRFRLYNHLSCYATKRESELKLAATASSWNPSAFTTPSQFQPISTSSTLTSSTSSASTSAGVSSSISTTASSPPSSSENLTILGSSSLNCNNSSISDINNNLHYPPPPPPPPHSHPQPHHNVHQYFPPAYPTSSTSFPPSIQDQSQLAAGVKYCRPWGAELAY